jgi:hypothetical protein
MAADLRFFWNFHRDESGSFLRSLQNVVETLLEMVRGVYAACVVSPIQQASMLLHQFVHNLLLTDRTFPQPMPDLRPDDNNGGDANGNPKDEETKKKVGTAPFEGRWDDPEFLAPAFLNPQEYPPDWKVYHPALGVVLKSEAEEYDQLLEKIREQEEQLRRDGICDDDNRPTEGRRDSWDDQQPKAGGGAAAAPPSETPEPPSAASPPAPLQDENALKGDAGTSSPSLNPPPTVDGRGHDDATLPTTAGADREEGEPDEKLPTHQDCTCASAHENDLVYCLV